MKKNIALILALVLALSFAVCGTRVNADAPVDQPTEIVYPEGVCRIEENWQIFGKKFFYPDAKGIGEDSFFTRTLMELNGGEEAFSMDWTLGDEMTYSKDSYPERAQEDFQPYLEDGSVTEDMLYRDAVAIRFGFSDGNELAAFLERVFGLMDSDPALMAVNIAEISFIDNGENSEAVDMLWDFLGLPDDDPEGDEQPEESFYPEGMSDVGYTIGDSFLYFTYETPDGRCMNCSEQVLYSMMMRDVAFAENVTLGSLLDESKNQNIMDIAKVRDMFQPLLDEGLVTEDMSYADALTTYMGFESLDEMIEFLQPLFEYAEVGFAIEQSAK